MKKLLFIILFIFSTFCFSSVEYNFPSDEPLQYKFQINGPILYQFGNASQNKFNVVARGIMKFKTLKVEENKYTVKITPFKTFISLNDAILEDLTESETAISHIISSSEMVIGKNGKIFEIKEVSQGILNIAQFFKIIPVFPEKLRSGKRWKQSLSSFQLPSVPACTLKFNYIYKKVNKGKSKINLLSNQIIRERQKEGDIQIIINGKNTSNGEFIFNEKEGKIEKFEGKFNISLSVLFKVPPSPEADKKTKQTVPLNINVSLNINFLKIK